VCTYIFGKSFVIVAKFTKNAKIRPKMLIFLCSHGGTMYMHAWRHMLPKTVWSTEDPVMIVTLLVA